MFKGKKAAFYTLGCKLNFSETSTIGRQLSDIGFEKTEFEKKADLYVINTCSVTISAVVGNIAPGIASIAGLTNVSCFGGNDGQACVSYSGNATPFTYLWDANASFQTTQCATGSVVHDIGLVLHKDAMALVEQLGVRSQSSYMQEYLGDLYTADTIYGVGEMRDTSGFAFVTDR